MVDTTRRIFCRTCGKEINIYEAKSYNLGRKTVYECGECSKQGETAANEHIAITVGKFRKDER